MADELTGAREKLRRGHEHAAMFVAEFKKLYGPSAPPPFTTKAEFDAKKSCFRIRVDIVEERASDLSLILGDALHNFRSALDHIAWQLARRQQGRTPRSMVSFPICASPARFHSPSTWSHIWEIGPKGRAMIENLQPYRQVFTGDVVHPLAFLSASNNKDKHRLLHIVTVSNIYFGAHVLGSRDCTPTKMLGMPGAVDRPLKAKMEILRVMVDVTGPHPYIDIEMRGNYIPVLDDGFYRPIGDRLNRIGEAVDHVIRSFEPIFSA